MRSLFCCCCRLKYKKGIQLSIFLKWVCQSWQSCRLIHLRLITISQVEGKQTRQKKRKQNLTLCLSPSLLLSRSHPVVVKMFDFSPYMQQRLLWMMCKLFALILIYCSLICHSLSCHSVFCLSVSLLSVLCLLRSASWWFTTIFVDICHHHMINKREGERERESKTTPKTLFSQFVVPLLLSLRFLAAALRHNCSN